MLDPRFYALDREVVAALREFVNEPVAMAALHLWTHARVRSVRKVVATAASTGLADYRARRRAITGLEEAGLVTVRHRGPGRPPELTLLVGLGSWGNRP